MGMLKKNLVLKNRYGLKKNELFIRYGIRKNLVLKNRYGLKKMSYSYVTVLETGRFAILYYLN
jgi:hypothetical protein